MKTCCDLCAIYERARIYTAQAFKVPVPTYGRDLKELNPFPPEAALVFEAMVAFGNDELAGHELEEEDDAML
jgi:hypothetical protein